MSCYLVSQYFQVDFLFLKKKEKKIEKSAIGIKTQQKFKYFFSSYH